MVAGELPPIVLGQVVLELSASMDEIVAIGPPGPNPTRRFAATPDELREWLREDDRGRYRPLPGALTIRSGWEATLRSELGSVVDAIYPLAGEHQAAATDGTLRLVTLSQSLDRQTGRYRVAAQLDERGRALASDLLCGQCVKQPVWRTPWDGQSIPCPEPCSVLVSFCREAATWQERTPPPAAPNPDTAYAAFETPGNVLREAYLRARYGEVRDG